MQDKAFINLRDELQQLKDEPLNLQYNVTFHDRMLFTFTGNMFGYPPHSATSHAKLVEKTDKKIYYKTFYDRFIFTALASTEFLNANKNNDVIYSVLPFYKAENIASTLGPTILKGVKAVIKKEFSVNDYFKDCKVHKCTVRFFKNRYYRFDNAVL